MSKTIKNEETGLDEIVYTQAELDGQLAEKDAHVATKLKEFETGKTAQELKDIERDKKIEEATKKGEDAVQAANKIVEDSKKKVVNFIAEQIVGQDVDLRKKLDDATEIIQAGRLSKGLDVASDEAIREIMIAAAQMAGISAPAVSPVFPMVGGMPPDFIKKEGELSETEHERFLKETGQEIPKKKEPAA